jgi:hypothetical protein
VLTVYYMRSFYIIPFRREQEDSDAGSVNMPIRCKSTLIGSKALESELMLRKGYDNNCRSGTNTVIIFVMMPAPYHSNYTPTTT